MPEHQIDWIEATPDGDVLRHPVESGSENLTITQDSWGGVVYPCRCGLTHAGDYGFSDYMHHECFHDYPLWPVSGEGERPDKRAHYICAGCGKDFFTEPGSAVEGKRDG